MTVSSSSSQLLWRSCISAVGGGPDEEACRCGGRGRADRCPDRLLHLGVSGREHRSLHPAGAGRCVEVGEPHAPDRRRRRPDRGSQPSELGLLPRARREGQVAAHHGLRPAGQLAGACHPLQLRRGKRAAQPLPRPADRAGRAGTRRRQAAPRHGARSAVAHLRRARARRARSGRPGGATTRRTSATTRRATCRWLTTR